MERAAKKLKSSRGASMVLALVFLLVCVMVGSSVLMAAASNAGRSRSNRQEQQLYLVLSSALQLVADDLNGTEYTSQVKYERQKTTPTAGEEIIEHRFAPQEGEMTRTDGSKPLFADIFRPALDSISKGDIKDILERYPEDPSTAGTPGVRYLYSGYKSAAKDPQDFTLTVKPEEPGPLAGYAAQVDVTIDTSYRITLTARMTGAPDTKALELFENYSLTTTLTRSGGINSLTIPAGEDTIPEVTLSAGAITWNAGQVIREYQEGAAVPPEAGP